MTPQNYTEGLSYFKSGDRFGLSQTRTSLAEWDPDGADLSRGGETTVWAFATEQERAQFVVTLRLQRELKEVLRKLSCAERELEKIHKRRAAARARYARRRKQ